MIALRCCISGTMMRGLGLLQRPLLVAQKSGQHAQDFGTRFMGRPGRIAHQADIAAAEHEIVTVFADQGAEPRGGFGVGRFCAVGGTAEHANGRSNLVHGSVMVAQLRDSF